MNNLNPNQRNPSLVTMSIQVKEGKGVKKSGEELFLSLSRAEEQLRHKLNGIFHTSAGLGWALILTHMFGVFGLIQICRGQLSWSSLIFNSILNELAAYGVTTGAHRLWSHRSYKARNLLRIILGFFFACAGMQSIWLWSAWHRVHHKYVDGDKDPHNINKGFVYAHIGWFFKYDHEKFLKSLEKIDMSDLNKDPIVMFHEKYYVYIHTLMVFTLPSLTTWYFFGDSFYNSVCLSALRAAIVLNQASLINSAAHTWGYRPYDKSILPGDSKLLSFISNGEGWHNYHHVFPWDYKASELVQYRWNVSTAVIDFFAWTGWAYDLKSVPKEIVMQRVKRTGNHHHLQNGPWGWGDKDTPQESILQTETLYLYPNKQL